MFTQRGRSSVTQVFFFNEIFQRKCISLLKVFIFRLLHCRSFCIVYSFVFSYLKTFTANLAHGTSSQEVPPISRTWCRWGQSRVLHRFVRSSGEKSGKGQCFFSEPRSANWVSVDGGSSGNSRLPVGEAWCGRGLIGGGVMKGSGLDHHWPPPQSFLEPIETSPCSYFIIPINIWQHGF